MFKSARMPAFVAARILFVAALAATTIVAGCGRDEAAIAGAAGAASPAPNQTSADDRPVLNAAFVVTETVFNSELVAPFDIFHHTIFRETDTYIRPFVVSPDGGPVTTFEGLRVEADYSFADAPPVDVLVIPSTGNSMSADLENLHYLDWIRESAAAARWVVTLCDGAFPLGETGLLNGRTATTFPGDRDDFAARYPEVDVRYDVEFVADGKFVTSVGGARSYEPALFVVEQLYGVEAARLTAEGMVINWSLEAYPHLVVDGGRDD